MLKGFQMSELYKLHTKDDYMNFATLLRGGGMNFGKRGKSQGHNGPSDRPDALN